MNPIELLRHDALTAMKAKDSVATTILRLALSEVQALELRMGRDLTDDEAFGAVRKLLKSNQETLAALGEGDDRRATLLREIEILSGLLPKGMSVEEIVAALTPVADGVKAAGNDGQATGVAMKHLKALGVQASGHDVSQAVRRIRA